MALRLWTASGESLTLGGLRGSVVLVNVMTTWSDLSLVEVPRFKELAERYDQLRIVAIALDEDPRMVRIFTETFEVPYPVTMVDNPARFMGDDGPLGPIGIVPTSFLLDRDGRIAARMDGTWPPDVLEAAVAKLLD